MPAVVPLGLILHTTDSAVISLEFARAFSVGATLQVQWVIRRTDQSDEEWVDQRSFHDGTGLRFGILYPDGATSFTAHPRPGAFDTLPSGPVLRQSGRGGEGDDGARTGTVSLWVWPQLTEGTHRLFTEWQSVGIPESPVEFDGALLRDAAALARPYWT